jgi:membrane-bound serine protease (ClpP class)
VRLLPGVLALVVAAAGVGFVAVGAVTGDGPVPAAAAVAAATPSPTRHVDVVQLGGLFDPVNARLLQSSVRTATADGALALVVQLDSKSGTVSTAQTCAAAGAAAARAQGVPVAVWVGPAGRGRAYGPAYRVFEGADVQGVAPGARIGEATSACRPGPVDALAGHSLAGQAAKDEGLADIVAPTLSNFIGQLDGFKIDRTGEVLSTLAPADQVPAGQGRGLARDLDIRFVKAGLMDRLLHGLGSPTATYLLLVSGLLFVLFEFFTAGVGIASGVGAVALLLSAYGLGTLPLRPWALVLVVVAMVGYGIDVQSGVPRVWTVIGTGCFIVGSLELFVGGRLPLVSIALVLAATLVVILAGMPSVVRTRFATPTIGREAMIGEMGTAVAAVDPDGTVLVKGAPWRARTNRATPIPAGGAVRVVAIDGLVLEVEPETGGAKDARH